MKNVLVLFAHPALERSRVNRQMINRIDQIPGVTLRDLYQLYPDFYINVQQEQELLLQHDIIVWQHPLYWYSVPPLLKQWIDLVLQHGWAYGRSGTALAGKILFNVFTSGGGKQAYCENGCNRYSIPEFFQPFEQTACLCNMRYWPPFAVHGSHRMTTSDIHNAARDYRTLLQLLTTEQYDPAAIAGVEYLNELIPATYQHQD